jgi:hypothetical protein
VKLLLKDYLATLGIQIPDGRSRKWSWCWKSWSLKEAALLPLFFSYQGWKMIKLKIVKIIFRPNSA